MAQRAWQATSSHAAQAPTQVSRAMGAPATRAASAPHGARGGPSRAGPGEPGRREGPWAERRQEHFRQRQGAAAVWPRQVWCPRLSCAVCWHMPTDITTCACHWTLPAVWKTAQLCEWLWGQLSCRHTYSTGQPWHALWEHTETAVYGLCRGREGAYDVEAYYQPSMLEDPWQHLRQQQQQHPPNAAAQLSSIFQGVADDVDSKSSTEGATDRPWH